MGLNLYISHTVVEKQTGDSRRLKEILNNGLKPRFETNESNDWFENNPDCAENRNYIFHHATEHKYWIWEGWKNEKVSGAIYINNDYIINHPNEFLNASFRNNEGNMNYSRYSSFESRDTKNSKTFAKFCSQNKIMPVNERARLRRLTNQIISKSVPVEAMESLIVTNRKILNDIESHVPDNINLFLFTGEYHPTPNPKKYLVGAPILERIKNGKQND